jgi:hypothetical protein
MLPLKTFSCANGDVAIRIPANWTSRAHETDKNRWGCYEDDNDTGTLWIAVSQFRNGGPSGPPADFNLDAVVDSLVKGATAKLPPLLESTLTPVRQGYHWRCIYDVEEDGEPLRFFFSHFYLAHGPNVAFIDFNLVLTHAQMDGPEFVELRDVMAREIRTAFLDPFGDIEDSDAEKSLGPLRLVSFNDEAAIRLPEAMGCWPDQEDEDVENRWYCRLETETSHAGMFVTKENFQLMEKEYSTEIGVLDTSFGEILENFIGDQNESRQFTHLPAGVIAYDAYDDPGESGPESGYHNHLWRRLQITGGTAQILELLLMIPLLQKDDAPYPALIAYMNQAVLRATFPEG